MSKTQELYKHARKRIPGGVQLLSKRPEQYAPGQWPAYYSRASGCEVWDLDGRHYYDMTTNGIGACLLGYADPDVSAAVIRRIEEGSMTSLNAAEEVQLADQLCQLHPWAEQVRFARTGGEICAIAVRIARATTGRDLVAICGYHGWSDWYLAANLADSDRLAGQLLPGLEPAGVPEGLSGTALTFHFQDKAEFSQIIQEHGDRLACVIMEPVRNQLPEAGFLEYVKQETHKVGGLLIFDEITIGWRLNLGGAHLLTGVTPDMAVFAKALGNGHPMAAVIGTKAALAGASYSFISSTYWTEAVGPVAALATLEKLAAKKVWQHIAQVGREVSQDWQQAAKRHGLPLATGGLPCLANFRFGRWPLELKTLYTVLMLEEGFLANTAIYPTLAHTAKILQLHREAVDRVFAKISQVLAAGSRTAVLEAIGGPVCQAGFGRLVT